MNRQGFNPRRRIGLDSRDLLPIPDRLWWCQPPVLPGSSRQLGCRPAHRFGHEDDDTFSIAPAAAPRLGFEAGLARHPYRDNACVEAIDETFALLAQRHEPDTWPAIDGWLEIFGTPPQNLLSETEMCPVARTRMSGTKSHRGTP